MADILFVEVGFVHSIAPGDIHHWVWHNAPMLRVWAFSVDAFLVPLPLPAPGDSARIQIPTVEYRETFNGRFEHQVHFWVKNTGTVDADYFIRMTEVRE